MDSRTILAFCGFGVIFWAMIRWKQAVQIAMVLVVLEGAIRKWLFPGAQDLVYFAKDVILLGAYAGFLRSRERTRYKPPSMPALRIALVASAGFGLLEIFNPNLPNLLVGALGFKAYFFYVPLLYVMPAAFSSDVELARFLRRYLLISVPVGLLAMAQFFSPASSALNTYARGGEEGVAGSATTFGSSSFVRVTGTFSYISGYGSYLFATAILILAILSAIKWQFKGHLKVYLALGMTFAGMMMTGSRGPVFTLGLLFPFYWYLAVVRERQGGAIFARLMIGLVLLAVGLSYAAPEAIEAFHDRALGSEDSSSRFSAPFLAPIKIIADAGPFGYGIGATHQTAAAVTQGIVPYSWLNGLVTEVESGRIMLELGPVGFLLVYWVRIYLIFFALRQVFELRTGFHRAIAVAGFLFFLAQMTGSVVFDVTTDIYFWFFGGLLMTVMRLDRPAGVAVPAAAPRRAVPVTTAVPVRNLPALPARPR
ncbi:MAG: hypothetical protein QOJ16_5035 [Acidobacteriota bacterium]|jgi:hypothetical protein|nr:hypothetical protein [Acidobacteriota bacterium]